MLNPYDSHSIKVLKGLDPVRKRPGMYIGSTGKSGLHHLVFEAVDNSIDEALGGFCTQIDVFLHTDGSVEVRDNGRGIPVDFHEEENRSALEVVMTVLHAGGKFTKDTYKVSGGLHGVGISVVNALSEWLEVWVKKAGMIHYQRYERGIPKEDVQVIGQTEDTGTIERFKPDPEIFPVSDFDFDVLNNRFMELAFLNPGLTITLVDFREDEKVSHCYNGGLKAFVQYLVKNTKTLHPDAIEISGSHNDIIVEAAIQYVRSDEERVRCYVNNINTVEGGTHLTGFRTSLTRVVNEYIKKFNLGSNGKKTEDLVIQGSDVREGLVGVLSLKIKEPQFEGQTKSKLGNEEAFEAVSKVIRDRLSQYWDMHPDSGKQILDKIIESAKARLAAKRAREMIKRKNALENSTLPGKLADCSSKKRDQTELFIVEGDSAGGSAKQARDREFQAILPLRGKILNAEKASPEKLLKNEQISDIITAIGTGIDETFDISKSRYGRIVIMTDADFDGAHIRTLLLTLFFRHIRPLITEGLVYIAMPPLFKVASGREEAYAFTEEEMRKLQQQIREKGKNPSIQRYKGLGEMNPEQLWKTTMDPQQRTIAKVLIEDAEMADHILSTLMGNDVEDRRRFIQHHALQVTNLDI